MQYFDGPSVFVKQIIMMLVNNLLIKLKTITVVDTEEQMKLYAL